MNADRRPRDASPPPAARSKRRRWPRWLIGLLTLSLLGWLAGDVLLARALTFSARRTAGWRVRVDRVRARLFPARVRIENLAVANPAGFPEGPAIVVREVYAEHGGRSDRPRETLLRELRIEIAQVSIVRRANGETNIDRLVAGLPETPVASPPSPSSRRADPPPSPSSAPSSPQTPTPPHGTAADHRDEAGRKPPARPDKTSPPSAARPDRALSPPRTWRVERMTVTIGAMEWKDESIAATIPFTRLELNRTFTFTNVTDMAEVGDRLAAALLFSATPKLLEEALAPLWE